MPALFGRFARASLLAAVPVILPWRLAATSAWDSASSGNLASAMMAATTDKSADITVGVGAGPSNGKIVAAPVIALGSGLTPNTSGTVTFTDRNNTGSGAQGTWYVGIGGQLDRVDITNGGANYSGIVDAVGLPSTTCRVAPQIGTDAPESRTLEYFFPAAAGSLPLWYYDILSAGSAASNYFSLAVEYTTAIGAVDHASATGWQTLAHTVFSPSQAPNSAPGRGQAVDFPAGTRGARLRFTNLTSSAALSLITALHDMGAAKPELWCITGDSNALSSMMSRAMRTKVRDIAGATADPRFLALQRGSANGQAVRDEMINVIAPRFPRANWIFGPNSTQGSVSVGDYLQRLLDLGCTGRIYPTDDDPILDNYNPDTGQGTVPFNFPTQAACAEQTKADQIPALQARPALAYALDDTYAYTRAAVWPSVMRDWETNLQRDNTGNMTGGQNTYGTHKTNPAGNTAIRFGLNSIIRHAYGLPEKSVFVEHVEGFEAEAAAATGGKLTNLRADRALNITVRLLNFIKPYADLTAAQKAARDALAARIEAVREAAVAPAVTTAAPAPTGTAQVGQTLTFPGAAFSGSPTPSVSRQVFAAGTLIASNVSTYLLTSAEQGKAITYTDTATNAAGSASSTSPATAAVAAAPTGVNSLLDVASGNVWFVHDPSDAALVDQSADTPPNVANLRTKSTPQRTFQPSAVGTRPIYRASAANGKAAIEGKADGSSSRLSNSDADLVAAINYDSTSGNAPPSFSWLGVVRRTTSKAANDIMGLAPIRLGFMSGDSADADTGKTRFISGSVIANDGVRKELGTLAAVMWVFDGSIASGNNLFAYVNDATTPTASARWNRASLTGSSMSFAGTPNASFNAGDQLFDVAGWTKALTQAERAAAFNFVKTKNGIT